MRNHSLPSWHRVRLPRPIITLLSVGSKPLGCIVGCLGMGRLRLGRLLLLLLLSDSNTEEYHYVIARSRRLSMKDVVETAFLEPLEHPRLVFFLNWWTKFNRIEPYITTSLEDGKVGDESEHFK